jgi:hypothetical protein
VCHNGYQEDGALVDASSVWHTPNVQYYHPLKKVFVGFPWKFSFGILVNFFKTKQEMMLNTEIFFPPFFYQKRKKKEIYIFLLDQLRSLYIA